MYENGIGLWGKRSSSFLEPTIFEFRVVQGKKSNSIIPQDFLLPSIPPFFFAPMYENGTKVVGEVRAVLFLLELEPTILSLGLYMEEDLPPYSLLRRCSVKKDDNASGSGKNLKAYITALSVDFICIAVPYILFMTVNGKMTPMTGSGRMDLWEHNPNVCAAAFHENFYRNRSSYLQEGGINSIRATISSYRVSMMLGTCLVFWPLISRYFLEDMQKQRHMELAWSLRYALRSTSPLIILGFARLISTSSVNYQIHVGEYGVHWNFFFTLAAVAILTLIINVHPKYCGILGSFILIGYQALLSCGLNKYLLSEERKADIFSQNKEGIFSIFGYWGMYLLGVRIGSYLFFGDNADSTLKTKKWATTRVWALCLFFWSLTLFLDWHVEAVSRRMVNAMFWHFDVSQFHTFLIDSFSGEEDKKMALKLVQCNLAYVSLTLASNLQVLAILMLSDYVPGCKSSALEEAFDRNLLASFLLANVLTGLVNLSVDTLSVSPISALAILFGYAFILSFAVGFADFLGIKLKFCLHISFHHFSLFCPFSKLFSFHGGPTPPQPPLSAAPPVPTTNPTAAVYPESIDSSPRSRHTDSWEADPPPPQLPQKLRLMCSYGGHIVPAPTTRPSVTSAETPVSSSSTDKLPFPTSATASPKPSSRTNPLLLKYQLPNEDLDSLISVSTDEDLENMVEEYDRLNNVGASDRGFSESSSVNNLLGLDDDLVGKAVVVGKDAEAQIEGSKSGGNGNNVINQDVNSVPDSPMLETTSSFGSTSSSPSVANLPPIRVHVEENTKKPEEVGGLVAAGVAAGTVASWVPVVVGGEYPNRVFSDDERSDHGGYRKVQQIQPQVQVLQQQQIPQFQQKQPVAFDLASPDSVSSEGSMTNALSRQRQAMYQESILQAQSGNTRVTPNQADLKTGDQNNSKIQMQPQVQESGYVLSNQYEQNHPQFHHPQQFVHAGNQYIPAGAMPMQSYYPIYPSQQQNHPHQPVVDQQYPFYFVPARQTQAYNMPMQQTNYNELAPNAPTNRPQTPPPAIAPHGTYNQAINAPSKPEMATGVYRTSAGAAPQLVQVPSSQHQGQYVAYTQIHHPSQSIAPSSAANSTYAYEFTDPTHTQMYYNQPLPPQLAAHYQTLTSAPAVVGPDASAQLPYGEYEAAS
ncbi:hypothetical protein DH2020_034198 [Rehmannia glutinosa]|uniref:PB1 domain-containing protein n=1 Tax=Rehmannia glutinosa TaxID=99300 RepID=A0ABR0VA16_REHGL